MSPNSNNNANRQMMKTKLKLHSDSKDNQSFDEGNNHAVNSLHRKHQNLQTNNFGKNQAPIDLNLQSIKDKLNKELRKVQKSRSKMIQTREYRPRRIMPLRYLISLIRIKMLKIIKTAILMILTFKTVLISSISAIKAVLYCQVIRKVAKTIRNC